MRICCMHMHMHIHIYIFLFYRKSYHYMIMEFYSLSLYIIDRLLSIIEYLGHKGTTVSKLKETVVGWPDLLIDKKDKT